MIKEQIMLKKLNGEILTKYVEIVNKKDENSLTTGKLAMLSFQ
jgi:hypothetical protein